VAVILASFGLDNHLWGTESYVVARSLQLSVTADRGQIWMLGPKMRGFALSLFSRGRRSFWRSLSRAFLLTDAGKRRKCIPRLLLPCWHCVNSCDHLSSQQCVALRLHRLGGIYFRARLYLAMMSTAADYKKLSNALWKCNSCCSTQSLVYYQSALFHVHTTKIKYSCSHLIM